MPVLSQILRQILRLRCWYESSRFAGQQLHVAEAPQAGSYAAGVFEVLIESESLTEPLPGGFDLEPVGGAAAGGAERLRAYPRSGLR